MATQGIETYEYITSDSTDYSSEGDWRKLLLSITKCIFAKNGKDLNIIITNTNDIDIGSTNERCISYFDFKVTKKEIFGTVGINLKYDNSNNENDFKHYFFTANYTPEDSSQSPAVPAKASLVFYEIFDLLDQLEPPNDVLVDGTNDNGDAICNLTSKYMVYGLNKDIFKSETKIEEPDATADPQEYKTGKYYIKQGVISS